MTYEEALSGIHSRRAFSGGGPTLTRIRRLMEALGNPQEACPCVHVAGTNGKGSVSAMIAAALRESGKRVGLFTSPYLVDFRERIQIDGALISKEHLTECYQAVMQQETLLEAQGYEPVNEFELVTAIGFLAFSRAGVETAVIEVGLGGRADPTNLISHPAVCCITPISLDHTAILGDTIGQIAREKAGIIKPGCPVVLSPQTPEAHAVFQETAERLSAPLCEAGTVTPVKRGKTGTDFLCDGVLLHIPLLGDYQMENAATAYRVCRILGLEDGTIARAFSAVNWPGRLQYFPGEPEILVDSGHNPAGIAALCRCLDGMFAENKKLVVMAMMKDKDYAACIPEAARRARLLIAATVGLPRSLPPERLAAEASPFCETRTARSVREALALARELAEPGDLVVVCGSVYAAGEALSALKS